MRKKQATSTPTPIMSEEPCRCDSGSYCIKHGQYSSAGVHRDEESMPMDRFQRCRGGRRIIRKRIGD